MVFRFSLNTIGVFEKAIGNVETYLPGGFRGRGRRRIPVMCKCGVCGKEVDQVRKSKRTGALVVILRIVSLENEADKWKPGG